MLSKKYSLFSFIFLLFLSACSSSSEGEKIKRVSDINYKTITNDLYTRFPGMLLMQGKYLVWSEPYVQSGFVHIIDTLSGKELMSFGQLGEGPNEYTMHDMSLNYGNKILLWDLNNSIACRLDVEKIIKDSANIYRDKLSQQFQNDLIRFELDKECFCSLNMDGEAPLLLRCKGKEYRFGDFPLSDSITNRLDVFQGHALYNPIRKLLVYSTNRMPYTAIYQYEKAKLVKKKEIKSKVSYTISDNELHFSKDQVRGLDDLSLSQDYIVMLKRDIEIEGPLPKPKKVRDMNQLSKSLYLYDYDLNLKKIINLKMPILRIAANAKSNTLYAIVANPEYSIINFYLD